MSATAAVVEERLRHETSAEEGEEAFVPVDFTPESSKPTLAEELADACRGTGERYLSGVHVDPLASSATGYSPAGTLAAHTLTLLASAALHLAASIFFLEREPMPRTAGGEPISVTMVGNAFESTTLSGEILAERAEHVTPSESIAPQETEVERAEVLRQETTPPVAAETAIKPEVEPLVPSASPLTAVTVAPPERPELKAETARETASAEPVKVQATKPERSNPITPEPETVTDAPIPTPRPEYTPPPRETVQSRAESQPRRGNEGRQSANLQRGSAQGQAISGGATQNAAASRRAQEGGSAAVTNYPGKIVSKLRRALRYPPEARGDGLSGDVRVSFTVTAGGSVSAITVAGSSGHIVLDRAAVETVQRAAPFPAIPAEAGRTSWRFTVPLAFRR